ncbi:hypothetical protein [Candidatus Nitrosocosmicus hydrocola]|jgi:hypothetical protein|uniref:hypothetical protein n=1 Tax=Candidatus Nitrosocosmicus hydrocola TaxID=1826872 RepID=UPI0011E5F823|nr:hypothetical protein [Candidatus Nitrosocosmicus hydrocola]
MNKLTLLIFVGTLTIVGYSNIEALTLVEGQISMENASNLTNPNNPTLQLDDVYNQTSELDNNSTESDKNLPSPM